MEDVQLNMITNEILDRTNVLKKCIKDSMTVGETYIIRGIICFEEVLKTINPIEINDIVIEKIQMCVNDILVKREIFSSYYMLGINKCYFILYDYNIVNKKRKLG